MLGMALRVTANRSTGLTPNMLQLGCEVNMPADILLGGVATVTGPVFEDIVVADGGSTSSGKTAPAASPADPEEIF